MTMAARGLDEATGPGDRPAGRTDLSVQNGPIQRSSSTSSILTSANNKAFPTDSEDAPLLENQKFRPASVIGPLGEALTLDSLPHPSTRRWVIRRKAEVVAAVAGGLLTIDEACNRYNLTIEEFTGWQRAVDRSGMPGLRVTRIQLYRRLHERQDAGFMGVAADPVSDCNPIFPPGDRE